MIDVPVERCRCFGPIAFKLINNSSHPYFMTAIEYLKGKSKEYDSSPLKSYYILVQPKNVAELLDIDVDVEKDILNFKKINPLGYRLPWQGSPSLEELSIKSKMYIMESKIIGYDFNIDDGIDLYGPVSERRGNFELSRIYRLINSISMNGYCCCKYDLVTGDVLYNNNDYVVLIRRGQHRSAVLAAMNYKSVSVKIRLENIICRSHMVDWKGVKAKSFSGEQSLKLFDRIYQGKQPRFMLNVWPQL